MSWVRRCLDKYLALADREDDTIEVAERKKLILAVTPLYILVAASVLPGYQRLLFFHTLVFASLWLAAYFLMLFRKKLEKPFVIALLTASFLHATIHDITRASNGESRSWPVFIILLDLCLVWRFQRFAIGLATATMLVLALVAFESRYRFGMFDLFQESDTVRRQECGNPPCSDSGAFMDLRINLFIFVVDFYLTRRFAWGMLNERKAVQQSVAISRDIAAALGSLDLETAERCLEEETVQNIPEGMRKAFYDIMANLRHYSEFLPQSCLPGFHRMSTCESQLEDSLLLREQSTRSVPGNSFLNIFSQRTITLCTSNMHNTHQRVHEPPFPLLHKEMLSAALQAYNEGGGLIDTFIGDRICASFNSARTCTSHTTMALRSSLAFLKGMEEMPDTINIGVHVGTAHCGDAGCPGMRRYIMLGEVCNWTSLIERLGRSWGVPLLASDRVQKNTQFMFEERVQLQRVSYRRSPPMTLWQVIAENTTSSNEEWMYELAKGRWDAYNKLVLRCFAGDSKGVLNKLKEKPWDGEEVSPETAKALRELVHLAKADDAFSILYTGNY